MKRFEEDANSSSASFRTGELFEISLRETRTAGFKWAVEKSGEPVIALAGESTEAASGPAGGAGVHRWQFRAVKAGTGTVILQHRRPWESGDAPERVFQIHILVTE
jgi:predicted secreted protein